MECPGLPVTSGIDNNWLSVAWGLDPFGVSLFVAVAGSGANRVMSSSDGVVWRSRDTSVDTKSWVGVTWGGTNGSTLFVAVPNSGSVDTRVITSADGVSWTVRNTAESPGLWTSVSWSTGAQRFVAVGSNVVMTS